MAKINFGGVVQDARGKQNGLVYSKNGSGAYVRRKVTPVNPRTLAQETVRSTFATLSKNWSSILTDAQRAAWSAFAKAWPIRNVFGLSVTLNGLNMYIRLNAILIQAGQAQIATPPANLAVTPIAVNNVFSFAGGTYNVVQTNADDGSGNLLYVFAAPPLPPGRKVTPSDYRFLGAIAQGALAGAIIDTTTGYNLLFGLPIEGQAINMLVSTVDITSGAVSVGQPIRGIAT